jgi:hypothetical protein
MTRGVAGHDTGERPAMTWGAGHDTGGGVRQPRLV